MRAMVPIGRAKCVDLRRGGMRERYTVFTFGDVMHGGTADNLTYPTCISC
jgi:uncharacterized protein (DUF1810 family)